MAIHSYKGIPFVPAGASGSNGRGGGGVGVSGGTGATGSCGRGGGTQGNPVLRRVYRSDGYFRDFLVSPNTGSLHQAEVDGWAGGLDTYDYDPTNPPVVQSPIALNFVPPAQAHKDGALLEGRKCRKCRNERVHSIYTQDNWYAFCRLCGHREAL